MDTPTTLTWVLARDQLSGLLPKIATEQLSEYFETARNYIDGLTHNSLVDQTKRITALSNGKQKGFLIHLMTLIVELRYTDN